MTKTANVPSTAATSLRTGAIGLRRASATVDLPRVTRQARLAGPLMGSPIL
jgi:hypothetical protein